MPDKNNNYFPVLLGHGLGLDHCPNKVGRTWDRYLGQGVKIQTTDGRV